MFGLYKNAQKMLKHELLRLEYKFRKGKREQIKEFDTLV